MSTPDPAPPPVSLVLSAQPGRPLTKAQRTFNRLVGKIERLQKKLIADTTRYDEAVVYYHAHLQPLVEQVTALRKDVVRFIAQFMDDRRFRAAPDQKALMAVLDQQLSEIVDAEGTLVEEDLRSIFETLHGTTFDDAEAGHAASVRTEMEDLFSQLGVDVDLSQFHPGMTDEEAAARAAELMDAVTGHSRPPKPPTKRQIEAEAKARQAEELRKKSIGTIYRQLAKALHPDLEQDPARRERKSALMQEVTEAYRSHNLHTLLRLELEWIKREDADVARLTDETLAFYNTLLEEQAAELTRAHTDLKNHPKYSVLVVTTPFSFVLDTRGKARAAELKALIGRFEERLVRLRARDGSREIREIIHAQRRGARL